MVGLLRDLPLQSASEEHVSFAEGLYEMWKNCDQDPISSPASFARSHGESSTGPPIDMAWCASLEDFAGPMSTWPKDVIASLQSVQTHGTMKTVAEWGYFNSVPLDALTDVFMRQFGATGEISDTKFVYIYTECFKIDAGLTDALDAILSSILSPEKADNPQYNQPVSTPAPITIVDSPSSPPPLPLWT